ncbi:MAG TPA: hypothetical protein ENH10_01160 [Bacteroidetes bacterium]|nr:hypothetical protein BMS3Bbin04_00411 [bacterium BMS3Bbin04]HDO64628.1 hypothetical protein [Bacteroidota bacterium]HEX03753.1 hypothetical protein [Bacteroidota bacterium]
MLKPHVSLCGSNRIEEINPFVRNDFLVIQDVCDAGTIVSIALRVGHVLEDIVLDEVHTLEELVVESKLPGTERKSYGMLYWIRAGRNGAFSMKAKVVKDGTGRDSKIEKLWTHIKDNPLRGYLARKARAKIPGIDDVGFNDYPDVMDTETAARYPGRS